MRSRSRRQFLLVPLTALASAATFSVGNVLGANQRVRVGLIGCGGRGLHVAKLMAAVPDVEFIAVCDVYSPRAAAAQNWAGSRSLAYGDFRRVLERPDLDAVLIATPDHWHALPTVLACQAGKDVYVEKPLAHNVREGRVMIEAVRRYRRVVQVGTQQRSAPHYAQAAQLVRSGALGPVHFVRIWNYLNMFPRGLGRVPDSDPPPGADWDFYLGPAPYVRFNRNRFVNTYRWFWDYAGGMLTDYGVHRFDSLHQIMGDGAPISVTAVGRRYELQDGAETPDVIQATFEYADFILSYEASNLNAHGAGGRSPGRTPYLARGASDFPHGEAFYGANGTLITNRLGFELFPEVRPPSELPGSTAGEARERLRLPAQAVEAEDATPLHVRNFIECVRSRQEPVAPVEFGHRATLVAHLGNIACRTGRKIRWDSAGERILEDPEAAHLLARQARKPWDLI